MSKKIAIITDSHFGIRKDNPVILDKLETFLQKTFFPVIDKLKIDTVGHIGDVFDKRKGVDFRTLDQSKRMFFEPLKERELDVFAVIGNHDTYYTNTNSTNSVNILAKDYGWSIIDKPCTVPIKGVPVCLIPWITSESKDASEQEIQKTKADILLGHLEIQGFQITKGHPSLKGMTSDLFKKFAFVGSGHFHIKSSNGNIHFFGTPGQFTWDDYKEPKGFHIFDLETKKLDFISNKIETFKKLIYTGPDSIIEDVKDCYVKIMVEGKSDPVELDNFIKAIESRKPVDIKVIDNKRLNIQKIEEDEQMEDAGFAAGAARRTSRTEHQPY